MLDLQQLDSVPADLDLMIDAAEMIEPARSPNYAITGPIEGCFTIVSHEGRCKAWIDVTREALRRR